MSGGNFKRADNQGQVVNVSIVSPLVPRVEVGSKIDNGRKKPVLAPTYQGAMAAVNRALYTIPLSPAPSSAAFTNNYTYQYNLLPGTIGDLVTSVRLNFQYHNTDGVNSVSISPPNMGIMRLEIYSGQNELLNTLYDTDIMIRYNLYYNEWEFRLFSSNVGLTTAWAPATSLLTIPANGYINFSLPIVTIWNAARLHMEKVKDAILLKFYFRSLVSGGSGTLVLSGSPSLAFDVNMDGDIYRREVDKLYDNNVIRNMYLDCFNISNSYTFTAGQTTKISLQNIVYKVPFLAFCLRANTNCTNNNLNNFASLGSVTDTTQYNIQVQDPSSYDILNRGSGLGPSDIQLINSTYMENNLFSNQSIYFIPFCTSVKAALSGSQAGGFYYFDGSLYQLAILPGNNFASGTYTLDIYVYYFRGLEICNGSLKSYNY